MTSMAHETTIDIKQRVPVKSIRVERDYSLGDGITRFQTEYPVELMGKVKITTTFIMATCLTNPVTIDYTRGVFSYNYRNK